MTARRPRLAYPFTVLVDQDVVWLVAGEDLRYSFAGAGLANWMPQLLERCDGTATSEAIIAHTPSAEQQHAAALIDQLYAERLLVNGHARDAHQPVDPGLVIEGSGPVADILEPDRDDNGALRVLVQDSLDHEATLRFNAACLQQQQRGLWVTSGPMARGYVSPLLLPDAGPCLRCLLDHYRLLSPVPRLYELSIEHTRAGGTIAATSFAEPAAHMLAQLVRWKAQLAATATPSAALYRLHVLDTHTLSISSHTVFADPECPACQRYKS